MDSETTELPIVGGDSESEVTVDVNTPPTAVDLVNFYAVYENGVMLLNWVTSWEQNTLGFHIYRGQTENPVEAVRLTPELIPGKGVGGGEYLFTDIAVAPNATYWYWLAETEVTGAVHLYGPVRATTTPGADPNWTGQLFLPLINR